MSSCENCIGSPLEGMRHAAEGIDFALGLFLAQADGGDYGKQRHQCEQVPVKNGQPVGGETAAGPEHGLRVLGAPPLDGKDDDRDVDKGEDVEDGGEGGAL